MDTVELLKGIEILSVNEGAPKSVAFFLLGLCLVVAVLIVYLIVMSIKNQFAGGLILGLFFLRVTGFLVWTVLDEGFNSTPTYKVIIDDSVSMNEFYDRYKVINTEGKIYSIQIKEN